MRIPYRVRRALRSLGIFLLAMLLVAVVVWMIWLLWLERFVVYTREGAAIDFNVSVDDLQGEAAVPPQDEEPVEIYYNEGANAVSTSRELTQLYGYYLNSAILQQRDMEELRANIESLPKGSAVLLEVKNIYGEFYYSSALGPESGEVNIAAMDDLISWLRTSGYYTIAMVTSFRDYYYGLNHDTYGLPHIDGGYLWADENYCYWLNPDSAGTMNYLINIVAELKGLGFNEVVFSEFRFPDTDEIYYEGDKTESLNKAAATLVANCVSETFAVSFISEDLTTFQLPAGRTRLYIKNATASQAKGYAESCGFDFPEVNLVFMTEAKDTRFDAYGVLRPITLHSVEADE